MVANNLLGYGARFVFFPLHASARARPRRARSQATAFASFDACSNSEAASE